MRLQTLLAVGGWENSQYFSNVSASAEQRATFIESLLELVELHGLDGVDIDWEYPCTGAAFT